MSTGLTTIAPDRQPVAATARRASWWAIVRDYLELTKPRIVALELVAILALLHIATGYGADGSNWSAALLASVAVGSALVAGSANAINQWIERERDALMPRTAQRPLPAGRLTPPEALVFGVASLSLGVAVLVMVAGPTPGFVALGTWLVYVALYTPMKTATWLNTSVGAVSGATPLWIGWTAGGGSLADPLGLSMVAVMYLWQFPHFMAIAWLCRNDYARAGYRMSTTLDPSGWWAGAQAVVGSALLIPVSLAPLMTPRLAAVEFAWAPFALAVSVAGLLLTIASGRFFAERNDASARRLLRASLLYVPLWLAALWLCGA